MSLPEMTDEERLEYQDLQTVLRDPATIDNNDLILALGLRIVKRLAAEGPSEKLLDQLLEQLAIERQSFDLTDRECTATLTYQLMDELMRVRVTEQE